MSDERVSAEDGTSKRRAMGLGLVGGLTIALIGIAGYTAVVAPSDPSPTRYIVDRLTSAGVLFYERPVHHHAAFVIVPSTVVSALVFYRHGDTGDRWDDLRVLSLLVGLPVCLVFVVPLLTGLVLVSPLDVLFGLIVALFVAPAVGLMVGAGSLVGYGVVQGGQRIRRMGQ